MKKPRVWGTSAAISSALALLVGAAPATAEGYGLTYAAPYKALRPTAVSSIQYPCAVGRSPVAARRPDAKAGRLDSSAGASVTGCKALAETSLTRWEIGPVLPAFVRLPAAAVATVHVENWTVKASGRGRRAASVDLKVGTGSLSGDWWTLAAVDCARRCTRTEPPEDDARMSLVGLVDSLPSTLVALIRSRASASGTGAVGVEVLGTLESVSLFPLAPFPLA